MVQLDWMVGGDSLSDCGSLLLPMMGPWPQHGGHGPESESDWPDWQPSSAMELCDHCGDCNACNPPSPSVLRKSTEASQDCESDGESDGDSEWGTASDPGPERLRAWRAAELADERADAVGPQCDRDGLLADLGYPRQIWAIVVPRLMRGGQ